MEVVAEQVKKTKHTFSSPERNSRMEDIEKSLDQLRDRE